LIKKKSVLFEVHNLGALGAATGLMLGVDVDGDGGAEPNKRMPTWMRSCNSSSSR